MPVNLHKRMSALGSAFQYRWKHVRRPSDLVRQANGTGMVRDRYDFTHHKPVPIIAGPVTAQGEGDSFTTIDREEMVMKQRVMLCR